jgi:hypothetical protein
MNRRTPSRHPVSLTPRHSQRFRAGGHGRFRRDGAQGIRPKNSTREPPAQQPDSRQPPPTSRRAHPQLQILDLESKPERTPPRAGATRKRRQSARYGHRTLSNRISLPAVPGLGETSLRHHQHRGAAGTPSKAPPARMRVGRRNRLLLQTYMPDCIALLPPAQSDHQRVRRRKTTARRRHRRRNEPPTAAPYATKALTQAKCAPPSKISEVVAAASSTPVNRPIWVIPGVICRASSVSSASAVMAERGDRLWSFPALAVPSDRLCFGGPATICGASGFQTLPPRPSRSVNRQQTPRDGWRDAWEVRGHVGRCHLI